MGQQKATKGKSNPQHARATEILVAGVGGAARALVAGLQHPNEKIRLATATKILDLTVGRPRFGKSQHFSGDSVRITWISED